MKQIESIAATNDVITLADGTQEVIADSAIEDAARQINSTGGMPQLIEHDWLRPIGWNVSASVVRQGGKVELRTRAHQPETAREHDWLMARYKQRLAEMHHKKMQDSSVAIPAGCDSISDIDCSYIVKSGMAAECVPAAFKDFDKDQLNSCRVGQQYGSSWRVVGDHLIVPHELFRRGFAFPNRVNRDLVSLLYQIADENPGLDVRIRWDENRCAIKQTVQETEERDYWWGPPFTGDPFSQAKGVAVHGPTKYDFSNGLIRSDFWWYGDEELVFEAEELIDPSAYGLAANPDRHGVRFVHSVFSLEKQCPVHLDGAIRFYTKELWQKRISKGVHIRNFGKKARREKLWRVDGEIDMQIWYDLIHNFFRGNFSIAEYFGVPDPNTFRSSIEPN